MKRFAAIALLCLGFSAQAAEDTLRMGVGGLPPQRGNPYDVFQSPSVLTVSAMFEGLTFMKLDGTLNPRLAVSWEAVDRTTWKFNLRKDVVFSNGKPFTSAAVVHAVDYLVNSTNMREMVKRELNFLEGAEAIDEHTVLIRTKTPEALFPRYSSVLFIVEPEQWQSLGPDGFKNEPVGTGPYANPEWSAASVKLTAHERSWRAPKIPELEILQLVDKSSRIQGVAAGRLDIVTALGPEDIGTIESAGGKGVHWLNAHVTGFPFILVKDRPVNDVRVRRALNMAVDRQAIVDILLEGTTVPANQPGARITFGHNPDLPLYPYDPEAARALLAEAGFADGLTLVFESSNAGAAGAEIIQVLQEQFRAVGVTLETKITPGVQYLLRVVLDGKTEGDALSMFWPGVPTIDALKAVQLHSCDAFKPWYCDDEAMRLIRAADTAWESDEALERRKDVMRYYHEQAQGLYLYETVLFAGLSARTQGFRDDFGFIAYDEIYFD